jgi:glycerol kinase
MCIWAKYIAIVEHDANNVWDTVRDVIKSLLAIHLELGEHVRKSNT